MQWDSGGERNREDNKGTGSRAVKITIKVAFKSSKIVVDSKEESRKRILQARRAKEETINIELTFKSSNFNSETMTPSC